MSKEQTEDKAIRDPRSSGVVKSTPASRMEAQYKRVRSRKALGAKPNRLNVAGVELDKENFEYRIVNDNIQSGRFQQLYSLGWEPVYIGEEEFELTESFADVEARKGSIASTRVGTAADGSPLMGYLMCMPKHLYQEVQAMKRKANEAREKGTGISDPSNGISVTQADNKLLQDTLKHQR